MGFKQISEKERAEAHLFWWNHREALQGRGLSGKALDLLAAMTTEEKFGFDVDKGEMIRPGDAGRIDLFQVLKNVGWEDRETCMLLAGVSHAEVKEYDREMQWRRNRFATMSKAELDAHIAKPDEEIAHNLNSK